MNGYNADAAEFEIKRLQDANDMLQAHVAELRHENDLLKATNRLAPGAARLEERERILDLIDRTTLTVDVELTEGRLFRPDVVSTWPMKLRLAETSLRKLITDNCK